MNYYGGYKLVGLFVTLGCWKEYVLCISFPDIRSFLFFLAYYVGGVLALLIDDALILMSLRPFGWN